MAKENIEAPADCKQCGMNRTAFSHSRMMMTYEDGSFVGTCSLNCVVSEMKSSLEKKIVRVQVADYQSHKLIDAGSALWIIGGAKKGVMTRVPKWAFATRQAGEQFVREHGGRFVSYEEALLAAEQEHADRSKEDKPTHHSGHGRHGK